MIVLHIAWTGNEFIIWGEKEPDPSIRRRRGRPPKNPGGAPHPFQAFSPGYYFTYEHALSGN
jgi:hypothetical protein